MAKKVTVLAVVLISLAVSGCTKNETVKNVCPIDGQAAEWVGQKNGKSCEFFHYSAIERHPTPGGPIADRAGRSNRSRCPTVRLQSNQADS
jgi:hypothetical protein